MMEKVMERFYAERSNLVNRLTIELFNRAGIKMDETYSNFDMIVAVDELKRKDYKIHMKNADENKLIIGLYKLEDLHEKLVYGYSLEVQSDVQSVKIVAIPIEIDSN